MRLSFTCTSGGGIYDWHVGFDVDNGLRAFYGCTQLGVRPRYSSI